MTRLCGSGGCRCLPVNALRSCHQIEMPVAAEQWERVLAAEGGDPEIVGGDGFAHALQFEDNLSVMLCGGFIDVEHQAVAEQGGQPSFVTGSSSRLRDAVAILAQHNHRNRHLVGACE